MSNQSGYKDQKNLSAVQVLAEVPTFIESLLSAIFAGALLLYVDLLDSLTYIIRHVMLMFLSKKLTKDLRFEYNYGVEKIEAMASLLCDGIMLFGMFLTLLLSVYSFFYPSKPSEFLIAVVGMKFYDLMWEFNSSLRLYNKDKNEEKCLWYLIDNVGMSVTFSRTPNCKLIPFYFMPTEQFYTLLIPCEDIQFAELITADYLNPLQLFQQGKFQIYFYLARSASNHCKCLLDPIMNQGINT